VIAEVRITGEVQIVLKKDKARTVLFGLFFNLKFQSAILEKTLGFGAKPQHKQTHVLLKSNKEKSYKVVIYDNFCTFVK